MSFVSGKQMVSIIAANSLACPSLSKLVPTCPNLPGVHADGAWWQRLTCSHWSSFRVDVLQGQQCEHGGGAGDCGGRGGYATPTPPRCSRCCEGCHAHFLRRSRPLRRRSSCCKSNRHSARRPPVPCRRGA